MRIPSKKVPIPKINVQTADVLVIGSGGAGMRCAIELSDHNVDVLVVGKCKKRDAHTILATGGINAALGNMDSADSWQLHAADTIKDGGGINDTDAVTLLCKNAPLAIKELDKWGMPFHLEKDGRISQRFFGAATYRRACFAGDYTGKHMLTTLVDQAVKRKIPFQPETYIFSLLTKDGKVNGALGLDMKKGELIVFHSKIVILCAGGHSRMYKRSSSRFWENNGDGIKLAWDVGAKFMDMEMFQFHPTGMVWPRKAEGVLVTEAVRGEGGILTNAKGERYMKKWDPERMELSARDVVARANYMEVMEGRGTKNGGVWLDISHKPKSYIKKRLPRMLKQFQDFLKKDISKSKMEVGPTAHYSMGGLYVDHRSGRTTVSNLYAIGEVTSGVHGGNRLGGNSLAECMVWGRLTGMHVVKEVKKTRWLHLDEQQIDDKVNSFVSFSSCKKGKDPIKLKEEIQQLMWKHVGVVRRGKHMREALKKLKTFEKSNFCIKGKLKMNERLIAALDVQAMYPTCKMIIESALARKESRAAHYRSDYPKMDSKFKKNIICTPDKKGKFKLSWRGVKPVPKEVKKYLGKREITEHRLE